MKYPLKDSLFWLARRLDVSVHHKMRVSEIVREIDKGCYGEPSPEVARGLRKILKRLRIGGDPEINAASHWLLQRVQRHRP